MGTRCQVLIKQRMKGLTGDWNEDIMLYHHYDGYPSNMLSLFRDARQMVVKKGRKWQTDGGPEIENDYLFDWEAGRAGKVASYLCAADPGSFEPEKDLVLHGDIEYFYVIELVNPGGGSVGDSPYWIISVHAGFGSELDKTPPIATFKLTKDTTAAEVKRWIKECEDAEGLDV